MGKPATQEYIAKMLGISRATVAEILGGRNAHRYNEKTRELVIATAQKMGYRPNRHAQVLGGRGSRVIGVIKSVSYRQCNIDLVLHLGRAIHERGYDVIFGELFLSKEIDKVVDLIHDLKVEGLILAHVHTNFAQKPPIQRLIRTGVPSITVGGDPSGKGPCFSFDIGAAGREFTRVFRKAGYEKIFVIARPDWNRPEEANSCSARMIDGFLKAALDEGYARESIAVCEFNAETMQNPMRGAEVIERLLGRCNLKNSVVVFESDIHATSAMFACHQRGISIPDEVGIIGLDGTDAGAIAWPPLTSLRLPVREMATAAVDALFTAITEKKPLEERMVLFPCQPIFRQSLRPVHDHLLNQNSGGCRHHSIIG